MLAKPRVVLALSCLAGGVFMAPFMPLATDTVDWQAMADAYTPFFADGFEDGTTDAWSATVNGSKVKVVLPNGSEFAEEILLSMNKSGRCRVPTALLRDLGLDEHWTAAGKSITPVDECRLLVEEEGLVFTFSMPLS